DTGATARHTCGRRRTPLVAARPRPRRRARRVVPAGRSRTAGWRARRAAAVPPGPPPHSLATLPAVPGPRTSAQAQASASRSSPSWRAAARSADALLHHKVHPVTDAYVFNYLLRTRPGRTSAPRQAAAHTVPRPGPFPRGHGPGGTRSLGRVVHVVVVPPLVRRCLRVALRRVLPCLLAAESGDVEVVPGVAHLLVAAVVDEVGPEDPVALADEGVGAVPLVDVEVFVEVVGDRVPGDVVPPVALLQAPDLGLGGAGGEGERRVPRVQVPGVRHLIRPEGTAHAGPLRVRAALGIRGHLGSVEGAVDDQLAAPLEQASEAHPAGRALEPVLLVDRQPGHSPAFGRQRVAGAGQLLFLDEELLVRNAPILRRDDRWCLHSAVLLRGQDVGGHHEY